MPSIIRFLMSLRKSEPPLGRFVVVAIAVIMDPCLMNITEERWPMAPSLQLISRVLRLRVLVSGTAVKLPLHLNCAALRKRST